MKRVLIISPHFPPTNAPDHQRVRMALQHLQEYGWQAHVLCAAERFVEAPLDPLFLENIPDHVQVTRLAAIPVALTRLLGMRGLAWRFVPSLYKGGTALLKKEHFDLAYFSTTTFLAMPLGRVWFKRFGMPYILDLQDPWRRDFRFDHTRSPGGIVKYGAAVILARLLEPWTLRSAAHITAVSPAYVEQLLANYHFLEGRQLTTLPFAASESDFALLRKHKVTQSIFTPTDDCKHITYMGRGGTDMHRALAGLFWAISTARRRDPQRWKRVRFHFIGTSYAPHERAERTVAPLADKYQVDDIVEEHPGRIPYFSALRALTDSDGLLFIGSDDPGYSASKIYPYLMARRPILPILHDHSPLIPILKSCTNAQIAPFGSACTAELLGKTLLPLVEKLPEWPESSDFKLNEEAFAQYEAKAMTQRLCAIFDEVLRQNRSSG